MSQVIEDVVKHLDAAMEHVKDVEKRLGKKCTPRLENLLIEAFILGVVRGGVYVVEALGNEAPAELKS